MNQVHNQPRINGGIYLRSMVLVALVVFALGLAGCSLLKFSSSQPTARVSSFQLSTNELTGLQALIVVQAQVMRFADTYSATVAQACDDVSAQTTNSALRLTMLRWKLGQSTSAFINATGQNPAINALDMLVLASMARMVVQDFGVDTYGEAVRPLLAAQENLESTIWTMANSVLRPSQKKELMDLIQEWRAKNPHQRYIGPIRFREFATALGKTPTRTSSGPSSIFSLLFLDPLAGLDPTAAAIEQTRELGERAMFYSQRMPMLLSWQVEVLGYQLAGQPESQQFLNVASRLAGSAEVFAQTAQQIPQLVNDQRQAAIQQILDGLTAQGNQSRALLDDTRSTLDSAGAAATNINAAIQSLAAFVQYVSPTNPATLSAATNRPPFNVLDYATAAAQIGAAATDLNALMVSVNQSVPQIKQLGQQTKADADEVVRRAFLFGLALILILLAGSVLAGLVYRRLAKDGHKSSGP